MKFESDFLSVQYGFCFHQHFELGGSLEMHFFVSDFFGWNFVEKKTPSIVLVITLFAVAFSSANAFFPYTIAKQSIFFVHVIVLIFPWRSNQFVGIHLVHDSGPSLGEPQRIINVCAF